MASVLPVTSRDGISACCCLSRGRRTERAMDPASAGSRTRSRAGNIFTLMNEAVRKAQADPIYGKGETPGFSQPALFCTGGDRQVGPAGSLDQQHL